MKAIRHILFAVRDPDTVRQPGIVKAIAIAKSFGAVICRPQRSLVTG